MNRLFNPNPELNKSQSNEATLSTSSSLKFSIQNSKKDQVLETTTDKISLQNCSTPNKNNCNKSINELSPNTLNTSNLSTSSDISSISDVQTSMHPNKLFNLVLTNIDKATENVNTKQMDIDMDSGVYLCKVMLDGDSGSTASNMSSIGGSGSKSENVNKKLDCSDIQLADEVPEYVCAKLCALIKAQLVKALQEINQRFCKSCSLSEIVIEEFDLSKDEKITEENVENIKTLDTSVEEIESAINSPVIASVPLECFLILDSAPNTHKFHLTMFQPTNPQQFFKAVRREHKLLKTALPPGVWVRLFEDRMDLLSVMIEGPKNTPYEDGMFLFDMQLGSDYPQTPPLCHYISYCSDRLNPNLYEDGKVCVSLLGTWSGRGSEIWGPNSTLLQVIVSIQGLILVPEPYFNEAGYEKQKGIPKDSLKYNL